MRSLASPLADGVLADAILIPPRPPIPAAHQYKESKGSSKEVRKLNMKKDVGIAKCFSTKYGNKG